MPTLAAIRASNAAFTQPSQPVAVFLGGTSGIGEGMARVFAEHTKGNSDIIINIFSSLPIPPSRSASEPDKSIPAREFVQCAITMMKNIQEATRAILTKYQKINYLVMSPGTGRDETQEGIDKKLAVHYYARWKFLDDLWPALKKGNDAGEQGAVMSVISAGNGALVAPTYNDLMLELSLHFIGGSRVSPWLVPQSFSEHAPAVKLIHACPGAVRTSLLFSPSWMVRASGFILAPLILPLSMSGVECGEYMWNAIYHAATTPGPWRTGSNARILNQRKRLWEHTSRL
ncbi:hypothetical protein M413DRAFT_19939 [Hebeloma cylindrosporum]|uniref:Ketoreductase (KR) domain-containing protein n=1 Tax=Hebeloma cylindrosporum TaxID=76867 RepID=A0A0C3C2Y3_HEBCY|nr:hypothetical protein M413DRAFT_19939 [Hebeloma cylindrosporum h7]